VVVVRRGAFGHVLLVGVRDVAPAGGGWQERQQPDQGQATSLAFTEALTDAGIAGSIGSVGDALDNALMESTIGL
jgi:transposase InsO family protein